MKMRDVAKYAGVSVATVSRVLKGDDNVRQLTKEKVLKAVEELNYVPNTLARNLSNMQSKKILVVVPRVSNAVFSSIYHGIQNVVNEKGYQVILIETFNRRDSSVPELIRDRTVEGAILLSAMMSEEEFAEKFKGLPVVLATDNLRERIQSTPSVSIDNVLAAEKAVHYLANLGHRCIAFLGSRSDSIGARERLEGYKNGLHQHGLKVDESLIFEGEWSLESGYHLANQMLFQKKLPTAIFAASDNLAIGAISALSEQGVRIPEDISIVGFDNIAVSEYLTPALTTIEQPSVQIGEKAADMLLTILDHQLLEQMHVELNSKLIIRNSCRRMKYLERGDEPK
ncbi:LacI family transcriptional regulator [Alkalihalobacillus sp. MEB130]|uniref:LacI family DNA-binding transcriptional regulator n=1 Tax=Alkalihalobacillus sp. MEB130 TaxID=2976704 RepID=UPI0028DDB588|nr:LacI family DNA-binding transcriptional regulator [Alkalihalobacillus sp. MEB130]MDT8860802.1 LacI family transcriptional regulator [Alkalihalobacillus sp. MEB130]